MNLTIITPVYNEGQRAVETIKQVLKIHDGKVVVVDDGSADNSYELLTKGFGGESRISILRHAINLGKGAAMKTGAKYAFIKGQRRCCFWMPMANTIQNIFPNLRNIWLIIR